MVEEEVTVNPLAPPDAQARRMRTGWRPVKNGPVHWTDVGFSWSPGYATWGLDHDLARKLDALKSPTLYAQVVESLNNSPIRHTAFGIWIAEVLERGMAKGDAAVPGIVQPEVVAARARGLDPARLAIMPDDRVAHADNDKHKADSMVLSREQYKGLAAGFARPEAVYWDARHNNALYVLPDPDLEWCVVLPLYMPSNNKSAVKKLGRFDGVATTYRTRRDALLGRILEKIR